MQLGRSTDNFFHRQDTNHSSYEQVHVVKQQAPPDVRRTLPLPKIWSGVEKLEFDWIIGAWLCGSTIDENFVGTERGLARPMALNRTAIGRGRPAKERTDHEPIALNHVLA